MLTAPKLISAILYGGLGWYASQLIIPHYQVVFENANMGFFAEVNAALCMVVGWKVAGPRAGDGWNPAVSYGLTTVVAMTIVSLFAHSFGQMIRESLNMRYDGPFEAVAGVVDLMIKYGQIMLKPDVLVLLVGGGIAMAMVVEWSSRRYR